MDGGKCILQLRGVRPFLSDKYDITRHPNFQYTADADDKNAFDTAADITQDVFLKLLENIHAVRMVGKFQNYLLTIAANTCNNYFKKAKPIYTDLTTFDITDDTGSALERAIQNENMIEVRKALHTLPDYQKEVIILRFYHELKIREIAKITESNIPTVKSRLRQGLQKIKRYLEDFKGGDI